MNELRARRLTSQLTGAECMSGAVASLFYLMNKKPKRVGQKYKNMNKRRMILAWIIRLFVFLHNERKENPRLLWISTWWRHCSGALSAEGAEAVPVEREGFSCSGFVAVFVFSWVIYCYVPSSPYSIFYFRKDDPFVQVDCDQIIDRVNAKKERNRNPNFIVRLYQDKRE